jgi:hypothetical protein
MLYVLLQNVELYVFYLISCGNEGTLMYVCVSSFEHGSLERSKQPWSRCCHVGARSCFASSHGPTQTLIKRVTRTHDTRSLTNFVVSKAASADHEMICLYET